MKYLTAAFAVVVVSSQASAQVSVLEMEVSQEAVGDGAPEGTTYMLFATTPGDILSIGSVILSTSDGSAPFNSGLGSDTEAPNPTFVAAFPSLGVDSYITTPGSTASAGDAGFDALPSNGLASWFDTDDNGAQTDFKFGQITLPEGVTGFLSGNVTFAGQTGPVDLPFNLVLGIPEPTSFVLLGMAVAGTVARRRRF